MTLEQMASEVEGIDTLQGLDFSSIYNQEQAGELNKYYKDGIAYAEKIKAENPNPSGSWANKFQDEQRLIYFPNLDTKNVTNFNNTFLYCYNLQEIELNTDNATSISTVLYACSSCKKIKLTSIKNLTTAVNAFLNTSALSEIYFIEWKNINFSFNTARTLKPYCIHYIIQNAVNLADGATARTLTLHATAKKNWQNSEYYEQDLAVLEQKGITIA
jgi:hypothetical protein